MGKNPNHNPLQSKQTKPNIKQNYKNHQTGSQNSQLPSYSIFFSDFEECTLWCNSLPLAAGADSPRRSRAQFRGLAELQLVALWHCLCQSRTGNSSLFIHVKRMVRKYFYHLTLLKYFYHLTSLQKLMKAMLIFYFLEGCNSPQ